MTFCSPINDLSISQASFGYHLICITKAQVCTAEIRSSQDFGDAANVFGDKRNRFGAVEVFLPLSGHELAGLRRQRHHRDRGGDSCRTKSIHQQWTTAVWQCHRPFKITSDGAGGWNFYIDGTNVANIPSSSAGMPTANTPMLYVVETDAQSGDTAQLFIHSMQWWSAF